MKKVSKNKVMLLILGIIVLVLVLVLYFTKDDWLKHRHGDMLGLDAHAWSLDPAGNGEVHDISLDLQKIRTSDDTIAFSATVHGPEKDFSFTLDSEVYHSRVFRDPPAYTVEHDGDDEAVQLVDFLITEDPANKLPAFRSSVYEGQPSFVRLAFVKDQTHYLLELVSEAQFENLGAHSFAIEDSSMAEAADDSARYDGFPRPTSIFVDYAGSGKYDFRDTVYFGDPIYRVASILAEKECKAGFVYDVETVEGQDPFFSEPYMELIFDPPIDWEQVPWELSDASIDHIETIKVPINSHVHYLELTAGETKHYLRRYAQIDHEEICEVLPEVGDPKRETTTRATIDDTP